ncbi:hypothetical protein [Pseudomonas aeruginosa]|uniref:hypothetical protein n=1 Tax=Pseudomonas aeruginosa TaxID=287 RepID=UPI0010C320A8|nr:hypothetical protein [Pseudomonas aeruginosa]MBW6072325.1 dual specificity protein phosphatase family protein [Pseudomonas aeruginosa]QBX32396.1 hypothetical protein [Pseudomonas phage PA1C]
MRRVKFYSRLAAQALTDESYIISIRCPEQDVKFVREHKAVLVLVFDDVEDYVDNRYQMFDYVHADKILTFIDKIPDGETLIVHCEAGVSRSAAVAKFLQGIGWEIKKDRFCNGKLDMANGRVYGMLRTVHYSRSKNEA